MSGHTGDTDTQHFVRVRVREGGERKEKEEKETVLSRVVAVDGVVVCDRSTHINPGLVLLGHLFLDLQSPEQLFEPHHGHRDQPAGEEEKVRVSGGYTV